MHGLTSTGLLNHTTKAVLKLCAVLGYGENGDEDLGEIDDQLYQRVADALTSATNPLVAQVVVAAFASAAAAQSELGTTVCLYFKVNLFKLKLLAHTHNVF